MVTTWLPRRLELKLAGRSIARTPLLTATAVLSLGIGVTLAASAYGLVAGMVFATLDVPDADRIVQLRDVNVDRGWDFPLELERYERRRPAVTALAPLAAYSTTQSLIERTAGAGRVVTTTRLTANGFDALRVGAAAGRTFTASDPAADAATAIVLGAAIAREHFRSPGAAVGQTILVDGVTRTVIGVMREGFRFPHVSDAWIPASRESGSAATFMAFGRLADGASLESAAAEYAIIAARDREMEPNGPRMAYRVMPFAQIAPNPAVKAGLWLTVGALVFLLLVSAANVANLLLARTAARGFEFAVRSALGASHRRLVSQVASEALVMTSLGALLGVLGASWSLAWFRGAVKDLPYWVDLSLRWDIVAFVAAVAALATVIVSVVPARQLATLSLSESIRQNAAGIRFGRVSTALIAVELAIAVAFLGAIGSAGRGLATFGFGEANIPADRILVAQVYFGAAPALQAPNAPTDPSVPRELTNAHYALADRDARALAARLSARPGVVAVGLGSGFPGNEMSERTVEIEGEGVMHRTRAVETGAGYFASLGATLARGREFTASELSTPGTSAIVNSRFADRYGLGNAIGRRIRFVDLDASGTPRPGPWREIVGVAPNLALNPGNTFAADGVYIPLAPTSVVRIAIRSDASPAALIPALHAEALTLPTAPRVQWSKTLAAQMAEPVALFRSLGAGLVVLGGVALLLSGAGIFALLSLRVTRQRREIAVRVALGATRTAVVRSILGRTTIQLLAGTAVGLGLAIAITRAIGAIPYEIGVSGAGGIIAAVAVLAVIAAAACAIPLVRALRVKPMALLRES